MRSFRFGIGPALCLIVLVLIGCGGGQVAARRGGTVFATAGGTGGGGIDLPSGGTGSTAGGATGGGTGGGETGGGGSTAGGVTGGAPDWEAPPLGDAALDVAFAGEGATPPPFEKMAGTGNAPGYAEVGYSYEPDDGKGELRLYASLGPDGGKYQRLELTFDHATFVRVGTKLGLTYAEYYAFDGSTPRWYQGVDGTAEVMSLGPGQSVTIRLDGVRLRPYDASEPALSLTGTVRSAVFPDYGDGLFETARDAGPLGAAGADVRITRASTGATVGEIVGTGDVRGFVTSEDFDYEAEEDTDELWVTGMVVGPDADSTRYQSFEVDFEHDGPIRVGTRGAVTWGSYTARRREGYDSFSASYSAAGGWVEVVAVGEDGAYAVRLNNVRFEPDEGEGANITMNGTLTTSASAEGRGLRKAKAHKKPRATHRPR